MTLIFPTLRISALPLGAQGALSALGVFGALMIAAPNTASAQDATSREVVQPLPSPEVQRLNRALMELARRPRRVSALTEAGEASLAVGDLDAAIGFYGRAADIEPNNPRVKLGLARVYLRSGRPVEAIPLFNAARAAGAPPRDVLSDQALAFDLIGDQQAAQAAYARALELAPQDDETRRRLALSQAISGNSQGFGATLSPLLEARDVAAIRSRAFGLAILGEQERAEAIVNDAMPRDLATRINPYLAYMPRLTPAQQAAAANLGIFPRAADIGREDPRIARFAAEGAAGALLEPAGEPLGAPAAAPVETVSQAVVQTQPQPPVESPPVETPPTVVAIASEAEPAAVTPRTSESAIPSNIPRPGFDLARSDTAPTTSALPNIATSETASAPASTATAAVPEPQPEPASVADAFAEFGVGDLPVASGSSGARDAVDLAAIEIPREAAPEPAPAEPAEPDHPRRIWVQLATGRDVDALGFDWRRFSRRAPELLDDFEPHVTPWGQSNRLLAGPVDSRAAARALVNALAAKGIETFSYASPEGREIQRLR